MNKFLGVLSVLAVMANAVMAEDVFVVTDANIDEVLKENDFVLIEFYAPWCGHCKSLAPEYEKAATALKDYEPNVVIAKCDATAETEAAKKYGVQGFPTLKWFVNGEVSDYGGGRTEPTIISWVKKKTGPATTDITTTEELESFKDSGDVVVVGVFETKEASAAFAKSAQAEEEAAFGLIIGNAEVAKAAEVEGEGIVVFKKFDEGRAAYEGDVSDSAAISEFVSGNLLPLIVPFSQENAPKIFGGKIKSHVLLFVNKEKESEETKVKDAATPVAKSMQGKMLFVTVDESDSRILEFFGIGSEDIPTARIVKMGEAGMKKYAYTKDEITSEGLTEFTEDYQNDKLEADLKSDEPLKDEEQENVWVLAGKNFEEIVNKPDTDVLVEFYAPWCGHCKKLEPIYKELGDLYAADEKLIIAKMDATANEIDRIQVSGFPTIYYFKNGVEQTYEGGRDKDGFVKFLTEQGHPDPSA